MGLLGGKRVLYGTLNSGKEAIYARIDERCSSTAFSHVAKATLDRLGSGSHSRGALSRFCVTD